MYRLTPPGHQSRADSSAAAVGGEPRGTHLSRDGDSSLGDGGGGGDDDDDDDDQVDGSATMSLTPATASKKKKSKKSKSKSKKKSVKQSSPPRVPLEKLFPKGEYPRGEILDNAVLVENTARTTAEESRYLARENLRDDEFVSNYRKAAEVHRQVRHWVQDSARPGQALTDIAVGIEDGVRALLDNSGLEVGQGLVSGMGFPTGLALNNCVAHYTPNPGQKEIFLQQSDVMKVDFGVHINGWILDSAFTMSFDPTYDPLLAAVKDATNTGIKVRHAF